MPNNRELLIKIAADTDDARRDLDRLDRSVSKTSGVMDSLKGAAVGAVAAFGAGQIVDFAKDTLRAASELEESINAVNVTFEEASSKILEFGETSAQSVGLAQSEFNALAVPLGAMLRNAGLSAEEAADQTLLLTQRAADMASVFNVDVNEALEAIQAGLRGEADPLEKFGVGLSAAAVEAYALENGLAASKAEIDDNAKAAARLGLVFEQTERVAGDFANTSDSLANQQRIAAAEFENLKAEIGRELQPAMSSLVSTARELAPVLADAASETAGLTDAVIPLFEAVGAVVESIQAWRDAYNNLKESSEIVATAGKGLEAFLNPLGAVRDMYEDWKGETDDVDEATGDLSQSVQYMKSDLDTALGSIDRYRLGQKKAGDATEDTTEAVEEQRKTFGELVDPALGVLNKLRDLQQAQEDYRKAVEEFGDESPEAEDALINLANATADFSDAQYRFATESGPGSVEALEALLRKAGVTDEAIARLIATIERLNQTPIRTKIGKDGRPIIPVDGVLASGGPAWAGRPYIVGEEGPELFIPSSSGTVVPNNRLSSSITRSGTPAYRSMDMISTPHVINVNVRGSVLTDKSIEDAVVAGLNAASRKGRVNGGVLTSGSNSTVAAVTGTQQSSTACG